MKNFLSILICLLALAKTSSAQCPTPSFTYANTPSVNQLLKVTFTNTTNVTPSSTVYPMYQLKYGDGSNYYFYNYFNSTTHNYATPGTYTVKLIFYMLDSLTQAISCKDSVAQTITVNYTPCASTFTSVINSNGSRTFTANSLGNSNNVHYQWMFGDGTTGTGNPINHTYQNAGTFTVNLVSTDSSTTPICVSNVWDTVTITNNTPNPCANHHASFTSSISGMTATFNNTSTNHAGQVKTPSWLYGDGSQWSSTNTHTYANPGTYTVMLKNKWYDSSTALLVCMDSFYTTITIGSSNPCANHHASFTKTINGMTVNFNNTSTNHTGQTKNSVWSFGDGTSSSLLNTAHTYANAGTYTVKLKTTWSDSANTICLDSFMTTVTIVTPSNDIYGYIIKDSSLAPMSPIYKVWLIKYDAVSNMLTAVDSLITSNGSMVVYYSFSNKPAGNYLVKATMTNQTSTSGFIPTYHDTSVYWNQAPYINHPSNSYQNIYMRTGMVTAGPGFIGGNVSMGANKGTGNGVAGQLVYLKDVTNQIVKSTVTDNNGDFSFSNLSVGTYSLYPEEMNYATTPIGGINLTASQTNATGYRFGKTSNEIKPKTTSISTVPTQSHVIFPNPANTKLFIRWAETPQNVVITITDLAGHKVYQSTANPVSGSNTELNIAQISSGIYFLILESDNIKHTEKLIIQH